MPYPHRKALPPTMPLAIGSYEKLRDLSDASGLLNLAWTQDERQLLDADVMAVVARELTAEVAEELPYAGDYMVKDPYGEGALGPVVADFFGRPGWTASVTCGAGVGPLLHALSLLAAGGTVEVLTDVYPDYPHWVARAGGRTVPFGSGPPGDVLLLERPALADDRFAGLDAVRELAADAARRGALVLVDESNANYCPARFSAANLAGDLPNLIVVRGLSKAYGLGGVRLGYCVASAALTSAVRGAVAPLGASSLSLRIGRRILGLGDVTSGLRDGIARNKPYVRDLLAAAGVPEPVAAADGLPYVLFPRDPQAAVDSLASRGVQGKLQPVWSARTGALVPVGRLSVPLASHRLADLESRLANR
ncbi:aminotransferase class I/II-fold pyridoxal phosphate-dependent enzyme [Streptomyces sp. NPDC052101]|uniref:aminotransferase class I/II-fold pyridoxal phosphate-dependent enzyme n=1 Tax=Streptomyces sp. NPDC052101 TaxID=3155763 RepID=UPI003415E2B5